MTESETVHLGVRVTSVFYDMVAEVSRSRGEGISSFVRRAILKELASLSFLPDEQKKALGINSAESTTLEVPAE